MLNIKCRKYNSTSNSSGCLQILDIEAETLCFIRLNSSSTNITSAKIVYYFHLKALIWDPS